MIIKKIKSTLQKCAVYNSHIAVAVSGGADSIALLYALHRLSEEFFLTLSVVHVNYNLRGDESLRETAYVAECCLQLKIPCYTKNIKGLSLHDTAMENNARDIRYLFFEEIQAEHKVDYIALAHSKNDQAETLLFRLIRGTGLKGSGAMQTLRDDVYLRPMLDCSRSEIESWLHGEGISWYIDSSNRDNHYSRNSIRNEVVPLLETINNHAIDNLASFSMQMQRLQKGIATAFEEWFDASCFYESDFSLVLTTTVATPFLSEFISALFKRRAISVSQIHVDTVRTYWARAGKELLLPSGYHAITLGEKILFKKRDSDEFSFRKKSLNFQGGTCSISPLFGISKDTVSENVTAVRPAEKGDVLLVGSHFCSVMEILKKRKIPLWLRKRYPVFIDDDGKIVAVFDLF